MTEADLLFAFLSGFALIGLIWLYISLFSKTVSRGERLELAMNFQSRIIFCGSIALPIAFVFALLVLPSSLLSNAGGHTIFFIPIAAVIAGGSIGLLLGGVAKVLASATSSK